MEKEIIKTGCRIYDRVVRRDGVDDEGLGSIVLGHMFNQSSARLAILELGPILCHGGSLNSCVGFWTILSKRAFFNLPNP